MVLDTKNFNARRYRGIDSEPTRISNFGDISTVSNNKLSDPLELLQQSHDPSLADLIDAIIYWIQVSYGVDEFVLAQTEFQRLTGKVFYDDSFYHQRMGYFLDYFIFERPFSGGLDPQAVKPSAFHSFLSSDYFISLKFQERLANRFNQLESFQHSLFQITKVAKGRMTIKNLFTKDKVVIFNEEEFFFRGFAKGWIIQGFLFHIGSVHILSQGMVLHPPQVLKLVKKMVGGWKKKNEQDHFPLLSQLARNNLAYLRHRNIPILQIYSR